MPPKKADAALTTNRGEVLRFKSPAEFFSENKNIAGFDNPGKSLYTTIRELVENSLDACESICALPDIDIRIEEMDGEGHEEITTMTTRIATYTADTTTDNNVHQSQNTSRGSAAAWAHRWMDGVVMMTMAMMVVMMTTP